MSRRVLPLPDTASLAAAGRRTALVRLVLGVVTVVLLAVAAAELGRPARARAAAGGGAGSTVVVLDLSGSTMPGGVRQLRTTLDRFAHGTAPIGLVLFSDTPVEVLPPGTAPRELGPFARSFDARRTVASTAAYAGGAASNPWERTFSGGTRISPALAYARRLLDRTGGGRAVLVSDLANDPRDLVALLHELLAYARDPRVTLRVVPLHGATAADKAHYSRFFGAGAFERPGAVAAPITRRSAPPAWPLVGAVLGLALVLAAAELQAAPLTWRSAA